MKTSSLWASALLSTVGFLTFLQGVEASASDLLPPVEGKWLIIQGPPCEHYTGNHCRTLSSRFAYDVVPHPLRKSCVGMPVYAPSAGQIIALRDGIGNGVHGGHDAGNHIVIKRSNNEYIVLAHLNPGSIKVRLGESVVPGQQIAECGNSGNSGGPHLHFHMQATPDIMNYNGAAGVPIVFTKVQLWNAITQRCEWVSNWSPKKDDAFC